jgi:hypothetical protein
MKLPPTSRRALRTILLALFFAPVLLAEPPGAARRPGAQPDGSILLPNMWSLQPAGLQVPLGDFPVNIAVHPGGKHAAVLHAGHGRHEIHLVDLVSARVTQRIPVEETFYGI